MRRGAVSLRLSYADAALALVIFRDREREEKVRTDGKSMELAVRKLRGKVEEACFPSDKDRAA